MAEKNLVELLEETGLKELLTKRLKAKFYKKSWGTLAKYKVVFGDQLDELLELPELPPYDEEESKEYVLKDLRAMGELKYVSMQVEEFIHKFFEVEEPSQPITKTVIISGNFKQTFDGNLSKIQALEFLESIGLTPGVDVEINEWVEGDVKYLKCIKNLGTKGLN